MLPPERSEFGGEVYFLPSDGINPIITVLADGATETDHLIAIADALQERLPELPQAWGQARPPCPGHTHPATPIAHDDQPWWSCPLDGKLLARIGALHDAPLDR